jgi:endogenous inhibitor of DNA gyrase (YacG/DUF329 family)
MSPADRRCPVCRNPVAPRAENRAWPFCSDRCRLQDLGGWLGEAYRIPGERAGDGAGPGRDDVAGSGDGEGEGRS